MSDEEDSGAVVNETALVGVGWVLTQPEGCGHRPDGTFVLALEEPIQLGRGDPISRLTFRKMRGRDWREFPTASKRIGDLLEIAARLTGRANAELDKLGDVDSMRVVEVVGFSMAAARGEIGSSLMGSSLFT